MICAQQHMSAAEGLQLREGRAVEVQLAQFFTESRHRVDAMAMIHEQLYQSHDLTRIDMGEYLLTLTLSVLRAYDAPLTIVPVIKTQEIYLDVGSAIPCGLIVNELVSNAVKYAFPGHERCGSISVTFGRCTADRRMLRLTVSDDGIGLPSGVDPMRASSLGLKLVGMLIGQLQGAMEIGRARGTEFVIVFPDESETILQDRVMKKDAHTP